MTLEERERLAQTLDEGTADHLVFAVHQQDPEMVADLIGGLTEQERTALLVVLAARCPTPRTRPDDGLIDDIAVERAAAGELLPLTPAERAAVIRRMAARHQSVRAIARHLHMASSTVHRHLTDKETAA
jgi:hypothetical protein